MYIPEIVLLVVIRQILKSSYNNGHNNSHKQEKIIFAVKRKIKLETGLGA